MFLGYQNNKIVLTANTRAELENTPCMNFDEIVESDVEYTLYDGEYLTEEEIAKKQREERINELKGKLKEIDEKSARSMRALLANTATDEDRAYLAQLEAQAEAYRAEIKELQELNK